MKFMQLYAEDEKGTRVFVGSAIKTKDYLCLECRKRVRCRSGLHILPHFYHLEQNRLCRQSGKTDEHLFLQQKLSQAYPGSELEHHFREINRIADVVYQEKKVVFEVQCSHMTAQEVKARVADYAKIGLQVIWILSEGRFNKRKISALETTLETIPHYYTKNLELYDLVSIRIRGLRDDLFLRKKIEIGALCQRSPGKVDSSFPRQMKKRESWGYHFNGDLLHEELSFFIPLLGREQELTPKSYRFSLRDFLKSLYFSFLASSCE
jgi:competence protein CoiA